MLMPFARTSEGGASSRSGGRGGAQSSGDFVDLGRHLLQSLRRTGARARRSPGWGRSVLADPNPPQPRFGHVGVAGRELQRGSARDAQDRANRLGRRGRRADFRRRRDRGAAARNPARARRRRRRTACQAISPGYQRRSDRFLRRNGSDIELDLPVSVAEAALGAKVDVPTVEGRVTLERPSGTSRRRTLARCAGVSKEVRRYPRRSVLPRRGGRSAHWAGRRRIPKAFRGDRSAHRRHLREELLMRAKVQFSAYLLGGPGIKFRAT